MQERFSDRARHAMALANREAGALNHDFLAPAHLMLGLIAEGACVATRALRLLNVDLDAVRDEVRRRMPEGGPVGTVGARTHTDEFKRVIDRAIKEARRFHHRYVGTEHLIVGLLACDGIPTDVLRERGVEPEHVRDQALALLRGDVEPEDDLAHSRHGDFEWVHQQELAKAFRSPTFWHTMILAVDCADRLGAGQVEPAHLLLALLRDPSSDVAALLREKDVTADWLRARLSADRAT